MARLSLQILCLMLLLIEGFGVSADFEEQRDLSFKINAVYKGRRVKLFERIFCKFKAYK